MAKAEMYPVESHDVTTYYVWDGFVRTSHWINVVVVADIDTGAEWHAWRSAAARGQR